ncbi:ABC transporter permease [Peptacetobacter hiranonis]|uniref:ABC transporter permease n=1 Tax=Peptacetobacter hiranonis TaxID=89152 RepID=UPI002E784A6E|nr:ABC transporter permease [Peptacetobacter hiranonis]MEE0248398.1 ABC transporter permease [Peptacetobacter hiranonis]
MKLNVINNLTLTKIKSNKLMIFILTIIFSILFISLNIKETMNYYRLKDAERYSGEFNLLIKNIDNEEYQKIKSYKNIKNISYSNTKSIIKIGEKVFPVEEINKNYLNNFETSILDGKLTNGVVVEKWVANLMNVNVGDTINIKTISVNKSAQERIKIGAVISDIAPNKIRASCIIYDINEKDKISKNSEILIKLKDTKDIKNFKGYLINKCKIKQDDIHENKNVNGIIEESTIFSKEYITSYIILFFFLTFIIAMISNVNLIYRKNEYKIMDVLGMKKSTFSNMLLKEMSISILLSEIFSILISIIVTNLLKKYMYLFNQNLIGNNINTIEYNKAILIFLVIGILAAIVSSKIDYYIISGNKNKQNIREFKHIKIIDKLSNKKDVMKKISLRYSIRNKNILIAMSVIIILSNTIYFSQNYYSKMMDYHNKKLINDYTNGYNYDILVESSDFNFDGISENDYNKIKNMNVDNKNIVSNMLVSAQHMGDIKLEKKNMSEKSINYLRNLTDEINENYTTSIKGGIKEEKDLFIIKGSVFSFDDETAKKYGIDNNKSEATIYIPIEWIENMNKDFIGKYVDFGYGKINEYSQNEIYNFGKNENNIKIPIKKLSNEYTFSGDYYTKDDLPQIIVSRDMYKKIFKKVTYNTMSINISDKLSINTVVEGINNILNAYNVNIVDKHEESEALKNSSDIQGLALEAVSIIIYISSILLFVLLYNKFLRIRTDDYEMMRILGVSRRKIKEIIEREVNIVVITSIIITVMICILSQCSIYNYFYKMGYSVNNFKFEVCKLMLICFVNIVVYIILNLKNNMNIKL